VRYPFYLPILLISILLAACSPVNSDPKETKDQGTPYDKVNNFEGISMTVKEDSIPPTGLSLIFENNSNQEAIYGDYFVLEIKDNGEWEQLSPILADDDKYYLAAPFI